MDFYCEGCNDTDYDDYVTCLPAKDTTFVPVLLYSAFALGLLGNALVLAVLWQKRRSWSVTDTFVFNLVLADLLLAATLPLWAVNATHGWTFGSTACQTIAAILKVSVLFSLLVLACLCIHYLLLALTESFWMYSRQKLWAPHATCAAAWVAAFVLSIWDWRELASVKDYAFMGREWCPVPISQSRVGAAAFLALTCLLGVGCGGLLLLLRRDPGCRLKERRGVWLLLGLTLAFCLSWLPYHIALVLDPRGAGGDTCQDNHRTAVEMTLIATATAGCMQCCVKPLLYVVMAREFRKRLVTLVRCGRSQCNLKKSLWDSVVEQEQDYGRDQQERGSLAQSRS